MNHPDLQPWEDWRHIFKEKSVITVARCSCRLEVRACSRPLEVCIQFDEAADAEIQLSSGGGRIMGVDEAVHIMDVAAASGLMNEATNMKSPFTECNCCSDCCFIFNSARAVGLPLSKVFAKSRYQAKIDQDLCTGCQKCIDSCNFDAVDMVSALGTKKLKAQVDSEKCFGCGCCSLACPEGAISMDCVRPELVPPDTLPWLEELKKAKKAEKEQNR